MTNKNDINYMEIAIGLAVKAYRMDEVPVGAVIVRDDKVISEGWNLRENTFDPAAHAEIVAIRDAAEASKNWRLSGATLYVTKEPCIMCCGAILNSRIERLVFGCRDEKGGGAESLYHLLNDERLNHRVDVVGGVLEEKCMELIQSFFRSKRV
ncbi:MAG: nucleoside deaminase [Nitrospirota bacterium]|nr:MAG: nucleoside deaminase [Nitrospirota bacterium]